VGGVEGEDGLCRVAFHMQVRHWANWRGKEGYPIGGSSALEGVVAKEGALLENEKND